MPKVDVDVGVKKQRFKSGLDELRADTRKFQNDVAKNSAANGGGKKGGEHGKAAEKLKDVGKDLAKSFAEANAGADLVLGSVNKIASLLGGGVAGMAVSFGVALAKGAMEGAQKLADARLELEKLSAQMHEGLHVGNADQLLESTSELTKRLHENSDAIQKQIAYAESWAGQAESVRNQLNGLPALETQINEKIRENARVQGMINQTGDRATELIEEESEAIQMRIEHRHREAEAMEHEIALNREMHKISQKGFDGPTEKKVQAAVREKSNLEVTAKHAEESRLSDIEVAQQEKLAAIAERTGAHDLRAVEQQQRELELEKEKEAIRMKHLAPEQEGREMQAAEELSEAKRKSAEEQANYALQQQNLDAQVAQAAAQFQADAAEALQRQIALEREKREITASSASDADRAARLASAIAAEQAQEHQQRVKIAERDVKLAEDLTNAKRQTAIAQKETVAGDLANGLGPRARAKLHNEIAHDKLSAGAEDMQARQRELAALESEGRQPEAAAKRVEIEAKKKELEGLRGAVDKSDFDLSRSNFATSAVVSSKASVGLGGGVAIFGGDLMRNQLSELQQMRALLQTIAGRSDSGRQPTNTENFPK